MNNNLKSQSLIRNSIRVSLLGLVMIGFSSCADFTDPYHSGGYNDPYYNGGYNGGYGNDYYERREWERNQEERRDLERERDRLEAERRELEEQKRKEQTRPVYRPPPPQQDHCPSGFSPSENKCSPQERRNGCRDIRLPSGLGCVSR